MPQPDFADDPERLARLDREIDAVHRLDPGHLPPRKQRRRDREVLCQAVNFQQRRRHGVLCPLGSPSRIGVRFGCVALGEPAPRRPGLGDRHLGRLFAAQRASASGQRGWKAQPGGRVARSGGWPGIASSFSLLPSFGIEPSSAFV